MQSDWGEGNDKGQLTHTKNFTGSKYTLYRFWKQWLSDRVATAATQLNLKPLYMSLWKIQGQSKKVLKVQEPSPPFLYKVKDEGTNAYVNKASNVKVQDKKQTITYLNYQRP